MKYENTNGTWAYTIVWRIENFGHCLQKKGEILYSPRFVVTALDSTDWNLCLFPRGRYSEGEDAFGLQLQREYAGPISVLVEYELSLFISDFTLAVVEYTDCLPFVKSFRGKFHGLPKQNDGSSVIENVFLEQEVLTVRCRMRQFKVDPETAMESFALSRIGVDRGLFVWSIGNFSHLLLDDTKSTKLVTASVVREPFLLKASLQGTSRRDALLCIRIVQNEAKHRRMLLCFKMSLLDMFGRVAKVMEDKHWFEKLGTETWVFSKSIARQEIIEGKYYLLGDVLSLRCEFSISIGVEFVKLEDIPGENVSDTLPSRPSNHKTPLGVLQEDLRALYNNKTLSDFELRTDDGSVQVHKNILTARSPVFKAMFANNMVEKSANWLHITDLDAETLEKVLEFMYTGTVEQLDWDIAAKLYYAADKYEVLSLKQKCTTFLRSNIDVWNICEVLVIADRHQDDELKSSAHRFLLKHADQSVRSKQWKSFMAHHAQLAAETMHLVMVNKDVMYK